MTAPIPYYGRTADEWDTLTSTGLNFLVEQAKLRRTASYTDMNTVLGQRSGLPHFDFDQEAGRAAMGQLLGRIVNRACDTYPGFETLMLSCLVIYVDGNDVGPGFYDLAIKKNLFHRGDDKTEFWIGQLNGVYDYFARLTR